MKEETLVDYRSKLQKIEELQLEIYYLYDTRRSVDTTRRRVKNNQGDTLLKVLNKIHVLEEKLEALQNSWIDDSIEIETWLQKTVKDVYVQSIIRYHFILGYNWLITSRKVYKKNSYFLAREVYYRFVENHGIFETESAQ